MTFIFISTQKQGSNRFLYKCKDQTSHFQEPSIKVEFRAPCPDFLKVHQLFLNTIKIHTLRFYPWQAMSSSEVYNRGEWLNFIDIDQVFLQCTYTILQQNFKLCALFFSSSVVKVLGVTTGKASYYVPNLTTSYVLLYL